MPEDDDGKMKRTEINPQVTNGSILDLIKTILYISKLIFSRK